MGAEPSVPMAQSTAQTTTRPARASTPDFAERIFSLMVLPAIPCVTVGQTIGFRGLSLFAKSRLLDDTQCQTTQTDSLSHLLLLHVVREVDLHSDFGASVCRRQRGKRAGRTDGGNGGVVQGGHAGSSDEHHFPESAVAQQLYLHSHLAGAALPDGIGHDGEPAALDGSQHLRQVRAKIDAL